MAACCGSSLTSVIALLGLSALGVGGYSYFSGDCGSCCGTEAALVAQEEQASPCCAGHEATTVAHEGSCGEGEKTAEAITVAHTEEGKAECCSAKEGAATECCGSEPCGGCCETKAETPEQIAQKNSGR